LHHPSYEPRYSSAGTGLIPERATKPSAMATEAADTVAKTAALPVTHPIVTEIQYYYNLGYLGTVQQIAATCRLIPDRVRLSADEASEVEFWRILTLPDQTKSRELLLAIATNPGANNASHPAAIAALLTFHAKDKDKEKEKLGLQPLPATLKDDLKTAIKTCSVYGRILLARFFVLAKKLDRARPLIDQLLQRSSTASDCRILSLGAWLYAILADEELFVAPIYVNAKRYNDSTQQSSYAESSAGRDSAASGGDVVDSRGVEEVASRVRLAAALYGRAKQLVDKVLVQMNQPDPLAQLVLLHILRRNRDWSNAATGIKVLQRYAGSISSLGHAEKLRTFFACGYSHWEKAATAAMAESTSSVSFHAQLAALAASGHIDDVTPEAAAGFLASASKMPIIRLPSAMGPLANALMTLSVPGVESSSDPLSAVQEFFATLGSASTSQYNSPATIAAQALTGGRLLTNAAILGDASTQPSVLLKSIAQALASRRDPACVWFIAYLQNLLGQPGQAAKILEKAAKHIEGSGLVSGVRGAIDAATIALTRFQITLASLLQEISCNHIRVIQLSQMTNEEAVQTVSAVVVAANEAGQPTLLYLPDASASPAESGNSLAASAQTASQTPTTSPLAYPRGICMMVPSESAWLSFSPLHDTEVALSAFESLVLSQAENNGAYVPAATHHLAWIALGRAATALAPFLDLGAGVAIAPASALSYHPRLPLRHVPSSLIERPGLADFIATQIILAADLQTSHLHASNSGGAGVAVRDARGEELIGELKDGALPETFTADEPSYVAAVEAARAYAVGGKPPFSFEALERHDPLFARVLLQCCLSLLAITPRSAVSDLPLIDAVQRCLSRSLLTFTRSQWLHAAVLRLTAAREDVLAHQAQEVSSTTIGPFTPLFANAHRAAASTRLGLASHRDLPLAWPSNTAPSVAVFNRTSLGVSASNDKAREEVANSYESAVRLLGGKASALLERGRTAEASARSSYISPFPTLAEAVAAACSHALTSEDAAAASEPMPRVFLSPYSPEAASEWSAAATKGLTKNQPKPESLPTQSQPQSHSQAQPQAQPQSQPQTLSSTSAPKKAAEAILIDEQEQQKILHQLLRAQQQQQQQEQQSVHQTQIPEATSREGDSATAVSPTKSQAHAPRSSILHELDAVLFASRDSQDDQDTGSPLHSLPKPAYALDENNLQRTSPEEDEDDGVLVVGGGDFEAEAEDLRLARAGRRGARNEDFYANAVATLDAAVADQQDSDLLKDDEDLMIDVPTLPTQYIDDLYQTTPRGVNRQSSSAKQPLDLPRDATVGHTPPVPTRRLSDQPVAKDILIHSDDLDQSSQTTNAPNVNRPGASVDASQHVLELQRQQYQRLHANRPSISNPKDLPPESATGVRDQAQTQSSTQSQQAPQMQAPPQSQVPTSNESVSQSSEITPQVAPEVERKSETESSTPTETGPFDPNSLEWKKATAFVRHALVGEVFTKHGRYGSPHDRTVSVRILRDNQTVGVDWGTGQMKFTKHHVKITEGKVTKVFRKSSCKEIPDNLCFSIVTAERTLDLQAHSVQSRNFWVEGLRLMIRFLWDAPR